MLAKIRSSLTLKLFFASFVSTHLPLAVALIYFAYNQHLEPTTTIVLLLVATVAGTALCLGSLWSLLHPLRQLRVAILRFRKSKVACDMRSERRDEIGLVTNAFSSLTSDLSRTIEKLERQATFDVVTGLRNRRWLVDNAAAALARARREGTGIAAIVMDIDHFKSINDRFGHDMGDKALSAVGAVVLSSVRPYDLAARIGGEEFAILLPGCDEVSAAEIANRMRAQLTRLSVLPNGVPLTASFGVCEAASDADDLATMLKHADKNLYLAKSGGRNRVVCSAKNELEGSFSASREPAR
ncbi:GGDEF domain-containing protein [Sinorhizobium sp. BG8]|uniref:GGDEF domain-containing protein n=1 Tax=Sinorhizobium sp. BG8 TaxID=2613773 RepID=UPI00193D06E6|nr:GGDEF domain-containing protein [Sinorhizobium sp. BG8]QRM57204.1 GGDEF domain-containing protein [Sinorhizobium sp. BG8]